MARLLQIFQIHKKCSDKVPKGLERLKNNKICSEATPGWRLPAVKNFPAPHGQSAAIVEKKYFLEWSWFWIFLGKLRKSTVTVLPIFTFFQKLSILVMKPARCWWTYILWLIEVWVDPKAKQHSCFGDLPNTTMIRFKGDSSVARILLYSSARSKTLSSLRALHSLSSQILSPLLVTKLFLNSRQPGVVLINMVAMIKDAIIVTMVKVSEKCGKTLLVTINNTVMMTAQSTWLQVLGELCSPSPGEPPPSTSLPIAKPRLINLVIMAEKHGYH